MRTIKFLSYITILMILSSCLLKQTETIDPFADMKSLNDSQSSLLATYTSSLVGETQSLDTVSTYYLSEMYPDSYIVRVKYSLKDIDVFELADVDGSTLEILSNSLIRFFAKLYFKAGGTYELDLDYFTIDFPEIHIDEKLINEIRITKATIKYSKGFENYDFKFIQSLDAAVPKFIFSEGQYLDLLLFDYDKANNNCNYKCINFNIYVDDALYYLNHSNFIRLSPHAVVAGLPEKELVIDGEIELLVSIKLPF